MYIIYSPWATNSTCSLLSSFFSTSANWFSGSEFSSQLQSPISNPPNPLISSLWSVLPSIGRDKPIFQNTRFTRFCFSTLNWHQASPTTQVVKTHLCLTLYFSNSFTLSQFQIASSMKPWLSHFNSLLTDTSSSCTKLVQSTGITKEVTFHWHRVFKTARVIWDEHISRAKTLGQLFSTGKRYSSMYLRKSSSFMYAVSLNSTTPGWYFLHSSWKSFISLPFSWKIIIG